MKLEEYGIITEIGFTDGDKTTSPGHLDLIIDGLYATDDGRLRKVSWYSHKKHGNYIRNYGIARGFGITGTFNPCSEIFL